MVVRCNMASIEVFIHLRFAKEASETQQMVGSYNIQVTLASPFTRVSPGES